MSDLVTVTLPLNKQEQKLLRYRWHRLIFVLSTLVTFITLIVGVFLLGSISAFPQLNELFDGLELQEIEQYVFLAIVFPFFLVLFVCSVLHD